MKLLYLLLRTSRGTLAVAILVGILSGASSTLLIGMIHSALSAERQAATKLVWAFAGLCVVVLLTSIASKVLLIRLSQGAVFDLRRQLSRRILRASLRHLEEVGTHRLLATLTEDVLVISNALTSLPVLCINVTVIVGCLIYLAWLSLSALGAVLGFMAVGIVTYQGPLMAAIRSLRRGREEQDNLFKQFRGLTEGVKELKLHRRRRELFLTQELEAAATSVRRHNFRGLTIYSAAASWGELLFFLLIGLLLFARPGLEGVTSQTVTGYVLVILFMMNPLGTILFMLPGLARARVTLQKIEALGLALPADPTVDAEVDRSEPKAFCDHLELSGVRHTYHGEGTNSFTLGPINLSLRPSEVVFLTGGNGSGKSTLAKVMTGLYEAEAGEIILNGRPVSEDTRESYRQLFSVVFSDFHLFDSLLGLDFSAEELDKRVRDYLVKLELDHKVQIKDGVLSTTALSQGQRKRLALLVAYLEDRPVYIFDEWAADQDPLFKNVFYLHLLPELKSRGKAILVISHDDRYYHVADRILRLDYGQMEEQLTTFTGEVAEFSSAVSHYPLA